jgi:hypothetical protein
MKNIETLALERGVDIELFRTPSRIPNLLLTLLRPIYLNVGLIEENLTDFYELPLRGTIVQIGDGPMRQQFKLKYPGIYFIDSRSLSVEELIAFYHGSDVFVFLDSIITTSILEGIIAGIPIAGYPSLNDIIVEGQTGSLNTDLGEAVRVALKTERNQRTHS